MTCIQSVTYPYIWTDQERLPWQQMLIEEHCQAIELIAQSAADSLLPAASR
jgi:hypothetical protein